MAKDAQAPLADFFRFSADFKSLSAWIAKGVVAAPFLDMALKIGPPWYSRFANSTFLSIFVALVVMYSFEFWRSSPPSIGRRAFRMGILLGVTFFILYLSVAAFFIEDSDDAGGREIIGYTLHENIRLMVESNPSKWTPKELLLQFHNPTEVWTRNSVITMRIVLLLLWLAMWAAIAMAMAAFTSLRWVAHDVTQKKTRGKSN